MENTGVLLVSRIHHQVPRHGQTTESQTAAHRHPPFANDPLTNWRYQLNQKADKSRAGRTTVMFWFLGSDSNHYRVPLRGEYSANWFSTSELNQKFHFQIDGPHS